MGVIYLASLIVGLGIIAVQLLLSGDGDTDDHVEADGGHFDADHDLDGLDADGAGHHDLGESDAAAPVGLGVAAVFLSMRFWTFGLMAFGLLGCFLHYLGLASPSVTAVSAAAIGVLSGWLASYTFLALMRSSPNSGASSAELVGQVGKVMLPPNSQGRAKIRLRVKGQMIDYVATTDEQLVAGTSVLVEEVRGEQVHVSAAPAGLKYEE